MMPTLFALHAAWTTGSSMWLWILSSRISANAFLLAVFGDAIVVDEDNTVIANSSLSELYRARKANYLTDAGLRREVICRWALAGPTVMLRKEALSVINGWSEDLRVEDWSFYLRLAARNALGFVDATVGAYRVHSSNMSRTRDSQKRIRNLEDFALTSSRHLQDFDEPERSLLRAQSSLVAAKISYLKRRPVGLALNLLAYAVRSTAAQLRDRH